MPYKNKFSSFHFQLFLVALLLFNFSYAQNFSTVDKWLDDNIKDLGGRAVVLVYKDGKIIYTNKKNEVSRKQKFGAKWLAKKTGKEVDLSDFNVDTRQPIASCSK